MTVIGYTCSTNRCAISYSILGRHCTGISDTELGKPYWFVLVLYAGEKEQDMVTNIKGIYRHSTSRGLSLQLIYLVHSARVLQSAICRQ